MTAQNDPQPNRRPNRRVLYRYAGMGFDLAASIIGLSLLGLWIDYHFSTGPVFVIVCSLIGTVGGLYNFIRAALRLSAEDSASAVEKSSRDEHDDDRES